MSVFAWAMLGGELKIEPTSITLANNTAKTEDITVPSRKRWLVLNIKVKNPDDVTRTTSIKIYKESSKTNLVCILESIDLGAGTILNWPNARAGSKDLVTRWFPLILEEGNTISVNWAAGGTSTGGTASDGLVITYLEVGV